MHEKQEKRPNLDSPHLSTSQNFIFSAPSLKHTVIMQWTRTELKNRKNPQRGQFTSWKAEPETLSKQKLDLKTREELKKKFSFSI